MELLFVKIVLWMVLNDCDINSRQLLVNGSQRAETPIRHHYRQKEVRTIQ